MKTVEIPIDRGLRILGGIILIGSVLLYFGEFIGPTAKVILFIVGVYSLVTGSINHCPVAKLIASEKRYRRKLNISSDITVSSLRDLSFFSDFSDDEIKKILLCCKDVTYEKDTKLMTEGVERGTLSIIYSGQVKVSKKITEDTTKTVADLGDGDIFGEMSFIENLPSSASVIALRETRVLEIDELHFSKIMDVDKALALKIMKRILHILNDRVRSLNDQVVSMGRWWIRSRESLSFE
ncbi:MAG: cyclic nucleotide-binding domain-containing protein [Thermodesulfobacteriota bacterium]|nr:cyclic nucleotide-binding domain-containing protein [Thermodesulfobacteriota bacterium]